MTGERRDPLDALHGWLTVLPVLVLAWGGPGSLLADTPTPSSASAGWIALLALPAGLVSALRGRARMAGSTLLLAALLVAALGARQAGDPFEARRAFLAWAAALVLALAGAHLGRAGRRVLARGLALAAVVAVLSAVLDRRAGLGGPVGNTGHLAELALPGAVLGLAVLRTGARGSGGVLRWVGGAAAAALAVYAGGVPVLTALAAWVVVVLALVAAGTLGGDEPGPERAAARAGARLGDEDVVEVALGAAALGILTLAAAGSPLLASPAAPAAAWPVLGAVLARRDPGNPRPLVARSLRLLPVLALGVLAARAEAAWGLVAHGRALARIAQLEVRGEGERASLVASEVAPPLEEALVHAPDSVVALEKYAELLAVRGAPLEQRVAHARRILTLRPHRLAVLQNLGGMLAMAGEFLAAEEPLALAHELDPTSPPILRNRLRLAGDRGDVVATAARLAEARAADAVEDGWLERSAADLLLSGRADTAWILLSATGEELDVRDANSSYELAQRLRDLPEKRHLADGARANANLLLARGHVRDGGLETAERMYFQALRIARDYGNLPDGAASLRLELAATQVLRGNEDQARTTLAEARPGPTHWAALPEWAGQALLDAGLFGL